MAAQQTFVSGNFAQRCMIVRGGGITPHSVRSSAHYYPGSLAQIGTAEVNCTHASLAFHEITAVPIFGCLVTHKAQGLPREILLLIAANNKGAISWSVRFIIAITIGAVHVRYRHPSSLACYVRLCLGAFERSDEHVIGMSLQSTFAGVDDANSVLKTHVQTPWENIMRLCGQ